MLKISEEDHTRVSTAVREAEAHTSGEIVTIVAAQSDNYGDVLLGWAVLTAFIALGVLASLPARAIEALRGSVLGWQARIDHHEVILSMIVLLAIVFALALAGLSPARMRLAPPALKARRVRARAIDYFRVGAEWRTAGRTAVLIYVSLAEHQVEIVGDRAIHSLVAPERWGRIAAGLVDALREGRAGDGLVAAVGEAGAVLAQHFPPAGGNPNELPDRLIEVG